MQGLNNPIGIKSLEPNQNPFIINPYRFAGAEAVGGWVQVGRTTLDSINDLVQVSSLPDKRYYMVLSDLVGNGSGVDLVKRVGNSGLDTGSNYANRYSNSGGADATNTSQTSLNFGFGGVGSNPTFSVDYWANLPNKEKLMISYLSHQLTAGAGTAPTRGEVASKWANTTNSITDIAALNSGSDDWAVGSEVVVLGWDPDDTHTSNFWEELASVDNAGVTDNLSSGTFSAKRYLWVQFYLKPSGNNTQRHLTFNNDTGSNYARRVSGNGGADSTSTSQANINLADSSGAEYDFHNMFIINNSSNEKLGILHSSIAGATGAGTAPWRRETVFKWANTSSQITEIDLTNGTGGVDYTISGIRVWGAD